MYIPHVVHTQSQTSIAGNMAEKKPLCKLIPDLSVFCGYFLVSDQFRFMCLSDRNVLFVTVPTELIFINLG